MIKGEPKQQVQYTMSVEKVMNLYVYWSISTVKSFDCLSWQVGSTIYNYNLKSI